ncbi:helix-turn-helix domain-containing protein [Sediminibacterium ginsengisoli]|uniref:Helix-turn-helix domain-containing protein n=1 Tax=Sediminibacterium ginsengisoli TaxID=413434 RepID=A0A1T4LZQ8_9BACT|nr:helix-turn-helix domain-containing protein [Sediminibacterium ginsengisoli]SJZ60213.1 Helix-turn-helix domain-containing protein [Sediminibacterium ginsengisoli]
MDGKYLLFFIGAIGAFNGLVLAVYFLFLSKRKTIPGFYLGILLAALSLRIGKAVLVYFNSNLPVIYLQVGLSACLMIGPALFFFAESSVKPAPQHSKRARWQLSLWLGAAVLFGLVFPYATHRALWGLYIIRFIYAVWIIYVVAAGVMLRSLFGRLRSTSNPLRSAEKWLLGIYGSNVLICFSFVIALLFRDICETYYGGAVIFSIVLYSMIFIRLYFNQAAGDFYLLPAKTTPKKMPGANMEAMLQSLGQLMQQKELYKNANLTVSELARHMNIPSHQLSQLLNEGLNKNFTSYVNGFRIGKACDMITEGHPYSLESIGYEVGFNSKSTFYTAFKKITGTTPNLYKENMLSEKDHSLSIS